MRNLLSAGGSRLRKDKLFWFQMLFMFGLGIFVVCTKYADMVRYDEYQMFDNNLLMYVPFIGCCSAVFCSMFIGTEYSEGTIRNKLIIGHTRGAIYGSNLLLSVFAAILMAFAFLLSYGTLGLFLLDSPQRPIETILFYIVISLFTIVAYVSLFSMISMLITKKSATAVICLLIFFGLLILAILIKAKLDAPEYVPAYSIAVDGIAKAAGEELNPKYLQPMARNVYQFFFDLLPSGQSVQLLSFEVVHPVPVILFSVIVSIVTTVAGIFTFGKKDLK